jgi:UDP-2,4-diacetamido-2,4,6-trideoxy-beta-L-altropyranose hydrolase
LDAPSSSINVLFAPGAGPGVGGGHVMRCLVLAEALAARGARCAFAVNAAGAALVRRFGGGRFMMHHGEVQAALAAEAFEVLVLDDYALAAEQERPLRGQAKLVVIDDLADRPHLADLLIDPGYGRTDADYAVLLPADAVRLTGPRYALVKPAFVQLRAETLARSNPETPRRSFISFGLSDIGGIAERAVAMVRMKFPDLPLDVALASDAASVSKLKARAETDASLHLHLDAANVADLMAAADFAVGAGGASTWERACLGLPALAVIVADNQRPTIQALAKDGALLAVELGSPRFEALFDEALARLARVDVRQDLRHNSVGLCDGLGARRVAEAILAV